MGDVLPSDELVEEPSDYGSLRPGTTLGRYELLVPIARGGMARVWAARLHGQRGFQKLVAIKTILPHLACEAEFERMFLDEARIASGVHHPNVCEIYELGEENRTLYLAMEWVSGDSFARVLRAGGMTQAIDARVVARVVADACAGLHAAHELTDDVGRQLGVVHRDLSPHNILLTADGVAKVADFGVAKALGQLHEATSAGQLKGKIHYMSPEQVTGAPVDRRSDVFSLGCVLYEATTGTRPFRGEGDHQVMHHLLKGEFTPPSQLIRGYPQELERIVQRAMSPQPILRFPTAERMRFALEEFLTRGPLVTQSNVAQVLRQRVGEHLENRKERIRQASGSTDRDGAWAEPRGASMTPSGQAAGHRSGVKQTGAHPLASTLQMGGAGSPMTPYVPHQDSITVGARPGEIPAPADSEAATMIQASPTSGMLGQGPPPPMPHAPQTLAMMPVAAAPTPPPPLVMPPPYPAPAFDPQPTIIHPLTMPAATEPLSSPPSGPYGGGYAPPAPAYPAEPPAGAAQYAIAAAIGVLLAVLIGVGGFFAWRAKHPPAAQPTAIPSAAPLIAGPPIVFRLDPPDASIAVDGVALPQGVVQIPRPVSGKSVSVVVRAPGREDATVFVDYFTKAPVVDTHKPAAPTAPPPGAPPEGSAAPPEGSAAPPAESASAQAPTTTATTATTSEPAKEAPKAPRPARPKSDDPVPDNPY
jgi:serine/threonine protein kinase